MGAVDPVLSGRPTPRSGDRPQHRLDKAFDLESQSGSGIGETSNSATGCCAFTRPVEHGNPRCKQSSYNTGPLHLRAPVSVIPSPPKVFGSALSTRVIPITGTRSLEP